MIEPYIGVTGFMSAMEIENVLAAMPVDSRHLFMVGVLASVRTLRGDEPWQPGRYPHVLAIKDIFVLAPKVLNLVHYAPGNRPDLGGQLKQMAEFGGPFLHGFQLNVFWPDPKEIEKIAHYKLRIVLQLDGTALIKAGDSNEFKERLSVYDGLITDVLVDLSGGKGKLFDLDYVRSRLGVIREHFPNLGYGVGGGLAPETVDLIKPLVAEFPNLSIDAEGRLRTPHPEDKLDVSRAKEYVARGLKVLNER